MESVMTYFPSLTKMIPISREDFAYDVIKEAILGGDLLPSQKISLTDLAKSLGVSIIPVNNAVRRLTSEGLIHQDPHHSPCVEEFSSKDTNEVLIIRYHMEELAMQLAVPNFTESGIATLYSYLDNMRQAVEQKDHHAYSKINRAFHMFIYSFSKFPMLCVLIDDLWNKAELNRCRSVFALVPNMAEHSLADHISLVEKIENNDLEAAIEVLKKHKNYSRVKLLDSLEKLDALNSAKL
jgi:DNA-binding GntR family transcriptional regulator